MTEKRFYVDKSGDFRDTKTGNIIVDFGYSFNGMDCKMILDLLNQLNDENEQLKQRNNRQAKQLDRLYSLVEKEDWRTLTDILDDFKRCEEQLQRESGTYGDFE